MNKYIEFFIDNELEKDREVVQNALNEVFQYSYAMNNSCYMEDIQLISANIVGYSVLTGWQVQFFYHDNVGYIGELFMYYKDSFFDNIEKSLMEVKKEFDRRVEHERKLEEKYEIERALAQYNAAKETLIKLGVKNV